ncbi:hypothetical protein HK102_011368 [Quaeritorhiza haematococci]|nr:hypothetical protein HK102_011368 [Quaeritorhiza haematococci]
MSTSIVVSKDYAWCILAATGMATQIMLTGGAAMGARKKYGVKYPDMGSGRYAAKLNDKDWEAFNNYQRAHYNYVEQITTAVTFELLCGLFFPRFSAYAGLAYIVGRQLYAWGYTSKGSEGRVLGAAVLDLALVGMFGGIVYGALKMAEVL